MASSIVQKSSRPRAIAKEKDGIVLYWVQELGVAGIHVRGVMQLLESETATVHNVIASLQGDRQITILEAEIVTPGGLQGVQLVTETDLPKVLRKIERSKAKEETRDRAGDIRDRLAAAGFKLMVMLELAPRQLKEQIDAHVSEVDKLLEIERLRYKARELDGTMLTMHGSAWLALQGAGIAERHTIVTEVVQPERNRSTRILTADQLKQAVKERTGQNLKSMAEFMRKLRAAGRDDLLVPVTRNETREYVCPDFLDEAIAVVYRECRQSLLGEG